MWPLLQHPRGIIWYLNPRWTWVILDWGINPWSTSCNHQDHGRAPMHRCSETTQATPSVSPSAGRHVHALRSGDAHRLQHYPRHAANDDLHYADVIEHGEKCRDEDNCRQYLEGEDGARVGRK